MWWRTGVRSLIYTNTVHVDAVRVGSGELVWFDETCRQGFRNGMEADEFFDARLHFLLFFRALVHSQHYRRNIPEDHGAHQRCTPTMNHTSFKLLFELLGYTGSLTHPHYLTLIWPFALIYMILMWSWIRHFPSTPAKPIINIIILKCMSREYIFEGSTLLCSVKQFLSELDVCVYIYV